MKAQLKYMHSPDAADLRAFQPDDPEKFGLFIEAMIGPSEDSAYESFDVTVCTPSWLADLVERDGPVMGFHYIIVAVYDYERLFATIQAFCSRCEGESWPEVAVKVGCLGRWEFEDYRE